MVKHLIEILDTVEANLSEGETYERAESLAFDMERTPVFRQLACVGKDMCYICGMREIPEIRTSEEGE